MNQIKKLISVIIIAIAMISMTVSVKAYTNNDVISYVTKEHTVNGRKARLDKTQRQSLTTYLTENPVTDSEADEIIAKLDKAKELIDNSGATDLSNLSESIKAEVISLIKSAGAIADLEVEVNTEKETVTIKTKTGKVIIGATSYSQFNTTPSSTSSSSKPASSNSSSSANKLVYTGNSISVATVKTILIIVAIVIIGCLVRKSQNAK